MLRRPLVNAAVAGIRLSAPVAARGLASHLLRKNVSVVQKAIAPRNRVSSQIRWYSSSDLPSHIKVQLPALSPTMEKGTIVSWDKKEGDKLNEGDLLCEIETDKATMGFETPEEGYLAKIILPAGTKDVPLGQLVCIIVSDEADIAAFKDFNDTDGPVAAASRPAAAPAAPPPAAAPAAPSPAANLPSHIRVALPALSPTMEKGTIVSWEKTEGDKLNEGDLLCEIETDKATMGFETPEEGYLARIILPAGTKDIPLGKLLCIIVSDEADIAAFKDFQDTGAPATAAAPAAAAPAAAPAAASAADLPTHVKVALPALSPTMEKGTIISWEKTEGDKLNEGDLLCEIETDKATMGFETPEEGYLAKIILPAGTKDIPLGKLLCIIVSDEADIAAFKNYQDTGAAPSAAPSPPKAAAAAATTPPAAAPTPVSARITSAAAPAGGGPGTGPGGRIIASPFARMLAASQGLDLASVAGTGPGGRIVAADLSAAKPVGVVQPMAAAPTPAAAPAATPAPPSAPQPVAGARYTDIDLTNMRQTIAKRLTESKQKIPHYSLTVEVEMDHVLKLREELNATLEGTKLSVNDFIVKASALACKRVPAANSSFMDTFIREYHAVDVSVAVSTPDGLITPIVFNADTKGLASISKDTKELALKAREKKLQPSEFVGGTFTVSNLGMFGVDHFSAIINPPQSCILSVGRTAEVAKPCKENGYRIAKVMKVTLNCDHRVVDGAVGAQWLQQFRNYLEKPHTMML